LSGQFNKTGKGYSKTPASVQVDKNHVESVHKISKNYYQPNDGLAQKPKTTENFTQVNTLRNYGEDY